MKKINALVMLLLLLATGCNTTKITSAWKAPDIVPREYKKIMVLGLIHETDRNLREDMENHLVGDLKELGYNALSSYAEYGPKAFEKMDETEALTKLKDSAVDAVITIVLLDKKKEKNYVPERMFYSPYGYYHNNFWGYRSALYVRIYQPGYYVTNTRYFWESNLYDMENQKLVYSLQTQSFDPDDTDLLGHQYGRLIVNKMSKENIIPNKSRNGKGGVARN